MLRGEINIEGGVEACVVCPRADRRPWLWICHGYGYGVGGDL